MKTIVVIQARTGSTRLPGKVLLPVAGAPLLGRMIERVLHARTTFELVVATTTDPADDPVVALARHIGVRAFRGHYSADHYHGVEIPGIYWHFVDVMWIVVYTAVYLL